MRTEIDGTDEVVRKASKLYTLKRSRLVGIDAQLARPRGQSTSRHVCGWRRASAGSPIGPLAADPMQPQAAGTTGSRAAYRSTVHTPQQTQQQAASTGQGSGILGLDPNLPP